MKRLLFILLLGAGWAQGQGLLQTFGSGTNQFQIEFVTIGNPGNAADTTGWPNPAGAVNYTYHIAKYEIHLDIINKYNNQRGSSPGISTYNLNSFGGNGLLRPGTGFTWNEAARFVNWLNTSQGYQAAYNFTTSGYNDNITLWGAGQYTGSNQFRHKDAVYVIPSIDEWYKAAYYDPNKAGGGGYWDYATGADTLPTETRGGTSGAVYGNNAAGPADVTNAGGLSPYGTMGQGGNVLEWNETAFDGSNNSATENRTLRGGGWFNPGSILHASNTISVSQAPTFGESNANGLRVAIVPEPGSGILLALALGGMAGLRSRRNGPRKSQA